MKIGELHQLMKNFELTTFDIEEEMIKYFFEGDNLSLQKIDSVMHGLGMPSLNSKDKEMDHLKWFISCDPAQVFRTKKLHRVHSW